MAKTVGLFISFLIIGLFINFTANQYKRMSGIKQFSPFSGWQMANNAMYAYKFIDSAQRKVLPERFKALDQKVRTYFDTTRRDLVHNPQEMLVASTFYMWDKQSPLQNFKDNLHKQDTSILEIRKWAEVGPLYNDYGKALIKTYPMAFAEYYMLPNFLKYYAPPVEFLETYSTGVDTVTSVAKKWFSYRSNKLKFRAKDMKVTILEFMPILSGTMNAVFIMISIAFFVLNGKRKAPNKYKAWLLFSFFWIVNMMFSVFASPVALRFQLFPFVLCLVFNLLLLDYIIRFEAMERTAKESI